MFQQAVFTGVVKLFQGNSSSVKLSQPCRFLPDHGKQPITDWLSKSSGKTDLYVGEILLSTCVHEGCKNAQRVGIYSTVQGVESYIAVQGV